MRCIFAGKSVSRRVDRSAGSLPVVVTFLFLLMIFLVRCSCIPAIWNTDVREVGVPMGLRSLRVLDGCDATVPISVLPVREETSKL